MKITLKKVVILCLIIFSSLLLYSCYNEYKQLKLDNEYYKTELENKTSLIQSLYNRSQEDSQSSLTNSSKAMFLDSYVAICPADGTSLYHKYSCEKYNKTIPFYICSITNAASEGYSPCSICEVNSDTTKTTEEIVYITNTGSKYHRSWCSYLKSSNPITKEQAIEKGYTPCSRCNP